MQDNGTAQKARVGQFPLVSVVFFHSILKVE